MRVFKGFRFYLLVWNSSVVVLRMKTLVPTPISAQEYNIAWSFLGFLGSNGPGLNEKDSSSELFHSNFNTSCLRSILDNAGRYIRVIKYHTFIIYFLFTDTMFSRTAFSHLVRQSKNSNHSQAWSRAFAAKAGQAEVVLVGCGAPNRGMGWYHAIQMLEGR